MRSSLSNASDAAIGRAYTNQSYLQVQWAYLSFLASLIAASGILLVLTIILSRRAKTHVWKGSFIAALQGLSDNAREQLGRADLRSELDEQAKEVRVQLKRDMDGMRLRRS